MPIFKIEGSKLAAIKESKIDLEKDLQKITEDNLDVVFGLKFISTEFSLQGFRIDTLAFDDETNSFVIIEYKRDRSFSVIDQGFAYLSLLLNNKDSFIVEYAKKYKNVDFDSLRINWSQSRVLFLANSFTTYQQNAINFRDLPIELWEVKKYDNNTILYSILESSSKNESLNKIVKNESYEKVIKDIKKITVDDHFEKNWENSRELFNYLNEQILNLDSRIVLNSNPKSYIGYNIGRQNIVGVTPGKTRLLFTLTRTKPSDLNDPQKKAELRKNSTKYYNQYLTDIKIFDKSDVNYAIFLIKQVIDKLYK